MQNFLTNPLPALRQLLVSGSAALILLLLLACSVDAQQLAGAAVAQQEASAATATPTNLTIASWGEYNAAQQNLPTNLFDVVAVAAGYEHSVALKRDGTVVSWGNTPPAPAGLNNVVKIAAGRYGTLALKNDGTLVAWGSANFGQLDIPAGLSGIVGMAMGDLHSIAVKQDGTVVVWGRNLDPKLKAPAGLRDVVAVSASAEHNLALKRDGTVVAWGQSFSLGLQVPTGLSGVVALAAGSNLDVALKSDGTVVAWGSADNTMKPPAGLTDIIAIDVDQYHAVALKRDGTLVKWGYTYLLNIPDYAKGVNAIALGYGHTLVLMSDTTAPETGLAMAPAPLSLNPSVFGLSGSDNIPAGVAAPGLGFECSLDGSAFAPCTAPVTYASLLPGAHTFALRAKDSAGNVDATPVTYSWGIADCATGYAVVDEASLKLGLACFKQYTNPGVYTLHILNDVGLSATPVVENTTANVSLLIDGQDHAWDGQGRSLHGLQVNPGTSVTVQHLAIRNAKSPAYNAGGVFNQGILTLEHVIVEANYSPSLGGGIGNHGTLTVRNSTIRNNSAQGGGGGIGNSQGTATLENSVIVENDAAGAGGLYNTNRGTVTLRNVLFSSNSSNRGIEIENGTGSTINGTPSIAPICYWVENYQTGQVLTVPNQSNTAGTALVAAAKQSPTNGYQLWVKQGNNALSSLPTGQWLTVGEAVNDVTPAVIAPQTPGAASQSWVIPGYGDGATSFNRQLLDSYALSPVDQTTAQTPVVLRHPDDFRYGNYQNQRNRWWLRQAPSQDCLAAMPVNAASVDAAPLITQLDASTQLPADAAPQVQDGIQPEPVLAELSSLPVDGQPSVENPTQSQHIFLPLVSN